MRGLFVPRRPLIPETSRKPALVGLAIMVGMMVNLPSLLGATFSLFLKPVSSEFGWGREEMSLAVFVAFLVTTPLYPLVGWLADRFGPRSLVLPGAVLFGITAISLSLANGQPAQFIALYLVASLAGTLISGVVFGRGVATTFGSGRGKALGICLGLGGGLGAAVSPILASLLIDNSGWRAAYVGLGLLPILVGLPVLFVLFRPARPDQERVIRSASLESRGAQGTVHLRHAIRDPALWLICLVIFFACLANNGVLVHLAALLTDRGASNTFAAALVSSVAVATCVGQISSGFLLDRFETPRVGLIFSGSMLAGLLLLQFSSLHELSGVAIVLFGLGIGSEYSLIPYYLSRYFGIGGFGRLYGMIYATASIAGGLGPYVMGLVFDARHSYAMALSLMEIGLAVALICIAVLPKYRFAATDN